MRSAGSSKLQPFFTFFGGKWRAAPHYPAPCYGTVVEPFAGSAGYAVRNYEHKVILSDADPVIVGLWKYLISVKAAEIRRLPAAVAHVREVKGCEEARWLVGFWLNKGMTAPCNIPSKWARNPDPGRVNTYWGEGVRERVARQVELIRHWKVVEGGYQKLQNWEATWYVDPPYQRSGTAYKMGSRQIDFAALGGWCRERRGQVIVCEQQGAAWLPFIPFKAVKSLEGANGIKVSLETIYCRCEGPEKCGWKDGANCQLIK